MRAGLSTIQQTLTPEAATVLNQSISEAAKRNHGHTTPLHVAATLLASPSGFLRQACIRSHPNSSHPLQCRALELCFSVALDRVPTAQNMAPGAEPPINNALMAALKRAQAHQRRGCPENQQQPLLAVKVELDQLIISILDDPSVSRVMREASFSSPAVKAMIEQTLNSTSTSNSLKQSLLHGNGNLGTFVGLGPRLIAPPSSNLGNSNVLSMPNRNSYVNPKLKQGVGGSLGSQRNDEVKKVFDIMMKSKKKNPVLVGDSEPEGLVKELLRRIEKGELDGESESERSVKNSQIISLGKELPLDQIDVKIKELGGLIESRMNGNGGIIIDVGDLKWLVELSVTFGDSCGQQQQRQQGVSEAGRLAVAEIANLLSRFAKIGKVWLIGSATCESYMRCQVYHPTMENDWDLQALPITSRSPVQGIFSRLGTERNLSNIRPLNPMASLQTAVPALTRLLSENEDPSRKVSCCPRCLQKYEEELSIVTKELENLSSENKSEATRPPLPQWLQHAKVHNGDVKVTDQSNKDKEPILKQKTRELQRKWGDVCLNLHPNFHKSVTSERIISSSVPAMRSNITSGRIASPGVPAMSLINPKLLLNQPSQPKSKPAYILGDMLQFNTTPATMQPSPRVNSSPASPVRTELALGRKVSEPSEETQEVGENGVKDFLGCISMEPQKKLIEKFASALDADSFKKLLKGLMERAWWQPEAASGVASAVTRCRLGNGKRRGSMSKGDIWLLFTGPDRVGKRKMASVLSEQICGTSPVIVSLGSRRDDEEQDTNFRGKTALDRIVEAVRRNPFSVIMLEDIDEVDLIMRGNIKRAMERGRLTDSHGREVSLGNVIFILTGNWSTMEYGQSLEEKKLACNASSNWQLKLAISNGQKNAKRRAIWMENADRPTKPRKEPTYGLSFDLNQAADEDDDRTDGSHNSSDLTVGHEEDLGQETRQFSIASVPIELINSADDAIVFKPVDFSFVRREIKKTISVKFSMVVDDSLSIQVDDDALDKILSGLWLGRCSLEEWVEKALAPSFEQLKNRASASIESSSTIQLLVEQSGYFESRRNGDLLPSKVKVMVDGAEI